MRTPAPPRLLAFFALLSLVFTAACGGEVETGPVVQPTLPLPPPDLAMLVVPLPVADAAALPQPEATQDPAPDTAAAPDTGLSPSDALARALYDRTGLSIDIRVVPRSADALTAFCGADGEPPTVAWLDGLSFGLSQLRQCGDPLLRVARQPDNPLNAADIAPDESARAIATARVALPTAVPTLEPTTDPDADPDAAPTAAPTETPTETPAATETPTETPDAEVAPDTDAPDADAPDAAAPSTGMEGVLLVSARLGNTALSVVRGRTFCRLGLGDFYSELLPTLLLSEAGVSISEADAIVDYPDVPALVEALAAGDCAMSGLSLSTWDALSADQQQGVRVAAATDVDLPYGVLVVPLDVELGVRLALDATLQEMAADPNSAALLRPLLGQDALIAVEAGDFDALADFLQRTGLDFITLGQ